MSGSGSSGVYWKPTSNVLRLVEEVGELAKLVNAEHGEQPLRDDEEEGDMALEMGDVLFALLCLANSLDVNKEEALGRVIEKYCERDAERRR